MPLEEYPKPGTNKVSISLAGRVHLGPPLNQQEAASPDGSTSHKDRIRGSNTPSGVWAGVQGRTSVNLT